METTNLQNPDKPTSRFFSPTDAVEDAVPASEDVLSSRDKRQPVVAHLTELRTCILRSFLWLGLGMGAAWPMTPKILTWLVAPIGQVAYLSPTDPFLVHFKGAFLSGVVLSFPLLAWEVWRFFLPALHKKERWMTLPVLVASTLLFAGGAAFGWQVLLPTALKVLATFQQDWMVPMLTMQHYMRFVLWMVLGCAVLAQIPLVVMALSLLGWVTPQWLVRQWKMILIGSLCLSAILTPTPDVVSQMLMMGPLCVLYVISIGLSALVARKRA